MLQEALVIFQRFRRGDPLMLGWENLSGSAHCHWLRQTILFRILETKACLLTDVESRLVFATKEGWGGMEWEGGVSRCKCLYVGRINNKVLLQSIENYIQYPVINHNGKAYIKRKHRTTKKDAKFYRGD